MSDPPAPRPYPCTPPQAVAGGGAPAHQPGGVMHSNGNSFSRGGGTERQAPLIDRILSPVPR